MNDEEYARMVVEAQADAAEHGGSAPLSNGPSLTWWTPEVNAIAALIDKVALLIETQVKDPKRPEPYTRPKTLVTQLTAQQENAKRWEDHKALTARVIQQPPDAGP